MRHRVLTLGVRPAGCLADYVISGWARVEVTEISRCVNGAGQQMFDCRFSSRPNGVTHIGFSYFRPINERRKRDKKKMAAGQRTAPSNFRRRVYSGREFQLYIRVCVGASFSRWRPRVRHRAASSSLCNSTSGCVLARGDVKRKRRPSVRPSAFYRRRLTNSPSSL